MSQRPRFSSSSAPPPLTIADLAGPLAIVTVIGGSALFLAVVHAAAAAAAGPGFAVPAVGAATLAALVNAGGTSLDPLIGPTGDRLMFWLVFVLLALPLMGASAGIGYWTLRRSARSGQPTAALAGRADYRDMRGKGARERARKLRPSLGNGPIVQRDLGVLLGATEPGGEHLYASEEDVALVIAGPRSNKTSACVVPAVLSAPGPVITTSNKIDSYTLTVGLRALVGRIFVLDPQAIAGVVQTWWWNPLRGIGDIADATKLVEHFVATVGGGNDRADPYFTPATARLLAQLVLAAARMKDIKDSEGSLRDVRLWLAKRSDVPVDILEKARHKDAAVGLQGLLEAPEDQKGGVFETALAALSCLESEAVARYVTPPSTWVTPPTQKITEFDPWEFVAGRAPTLDPANGSLAPGNRSVAEATWLPPTDTMYALTREGAGSAAPVVAALVDKLLRTAGEAATASGGRIDPPLRAVLDEAANICPIKNLPDLYSYFGSMSIQVLTFLQSEAQAVALWGRAGADKLWSAATIKLIGAGVHDGEFCERLSRLIGPHEVPTWSDQRGRGGHSTTRSFRDKRILEAADIAALPKSHAVLISTGRRAGLIRLLPWYTEPDAALISERASATAEEVRRAAIASLGPNNPLARRIAARAGEQAAR